MIRISLAVLFLSTLAFAQNGQTPAVDPNAQQHAAAQNPTSQQNAVAQDPNAQQNGAAQNAAAQNGAQQNAVAQDPNAPQNGAAQQTAQQNLAPDQSAQQNVDPNASHHGWSCNGHWGGNDGHHWGADDGHWGSNGERGWMEHRYDRWGRQSDPWHAALEVGGVFGTGLTAQLSLRAWSFALGAGAIGFGDRSLDRFRSDDRDHGLRGGVTQGYFLSLDRYASWGRSGFFYGAKLGVADSFLFDKLGNKTTFWGGFVTPELGAQFFPFQRHVFVKPAVGATLVLARFSSTGDAPIPPFIVPSFSISVGAAL